MGEKYKNYNKQQQQKKITKNKNKHTTSIHNFHTKNQFKVKNINIIKGTKKYNNSKQQK